MALAIPPHLAKFAWYAGHQAWLKQYGEYYRHDPGEAKPAGANLADAYLADAYLVGANLARADLAGAYLAGAFLADAKSLASREECIARLDIIREHICEHGDQLKMNVWHDEQWSPSVEPQHACQTAHCLAGWAQALCDDEEVRRLPPVTAGILLIPLAVGKFYSTDEDVKRWLEDREYAK